MTIEGSASAPRFRRANGSLIEPAPQLPSTSTAGQLPRFAPSEPPPWGKGEPMDLDLAVFVLADRYVRRQEAADTADATEGPNPWASVSVGSG